MDNDRDILLVAMFTFLTVFLWIFFELVQTSRTSTVSVSINKILEPIEATIDADTLTELEQRTNYR